MTDAFKELRSMILLELCCPPLPVMAIRQESGEQVITNTHDMMSVFILTSFKRQDTAENNRRREEQIRIEQTYQEELYQCTTFAQVYAHMSWFASAYLGTYLLQGAGFTAQDIRILAPEYISPHLKEEIRAYTSALRMLAELTPEDLADQSVETLFMSCIRSAVHKKQQSVVGVPVLVGVGDDVCKEGHNPHTLESSVEVL